MNPHTEAHEEAQEALPWLANGSLAGPELERVQSHLQGCAGCRADLALLHTLRAAGHASDDTPAPDCDVERAFARLLPRLDDADETVAAPIKTAAVTPLPAARGWKERFAANDRSWLRVAAGLQCALIVVLAALLARPGAAPDAPASYRALGAQPGARSGIIVTFRPDTPEHELRRIVLAGGARIAGGPTATGAWLLDADGDPAAAVARLRAEPAVTLAEALGAGSTP